MHIIEVQFHRYKLNSVICDCGERKYFERGVDAKYRAEMHGKENAPATIQYYQNGEPIESPTRHKDKRMANPGRYNGSNFAGK